VTETGPSMTPAAPSAPQAANVAALPDVMYCANHPDVETLLRCNRCGKPICLKCATLTDVGYRCKECIRQVQDVYFNAQPSDNIVAFFVALGVTAVATPLAIIVFGFLSRIWLAWILAFLIGGAAGGILAQIIRTAIHRRRGRALRYVALAGIILGIFAGMAIVNLFLGYPTAVLLNPGLLIFAALAVITTYNILR
jgi:hypothetical protein